MNGTRLDRVKTAAHHIIDQLNENDIISIVSFNDRAEVVIAACAVDDKPALKAKISMLIASGGTEIYQGLLAGVSQNRMFAGPRMINHVVLLTDGHTFGDHDNCVRLARECKQEGIAISAMGLGQDWNDDFLDKLASTTGGSSTYISSASAVIQFLNDHVRSLSNIFAERVEISVAPDPDIQLESAFRILPQPQPLAQDEGFIPLGSLQINRSISVLFQFQLPPAMEIGFRSMVRMLISGNILENDSASYQTITDVSLEVSETPLLEDPPSVIMDALGRLTLYRMQERAQTALNEGNIEEATRRLENLATRLLAMGHSDLANQAMAEARRVAHTSAFSDKGRKTLKYETRHLLLDTFSSEDLLS
jgi:Ca-activated chloride channel family protein